MKNDCQHKLQCCRRLVRTQAGKLDRNDGLETGVPRLQQLPQLLLLLLLMMMMMVTLGCGWPLVIVHCSI